MLSKKLTTDITVISNVVIKKAKKKYKAIKLKGVTCKVPCKVVLVIILGQVGFSVFQ